VGIVESESDTERSLPARILPCPALPYGKIPLVELLHGW
jgi:hypothetical protein